MSNAYTFRDRNNNQSKESKGSLISNGGMILNTSRPQSETNFEQNRKPYNYNEYISSNNNVVPSFTNFDRSRDNQYESIVTELNTTKRLVKNVLENQTELQTKIIEYNKIINEQESIIRINNIKLNEHDSKLTEILLTFNNYLSLNDKTNRILNDLSAKSEDSVKKNDFMDLKSNLYSFNRSTETKIFDIFGKIDDLYMRSTELRKEQEILQGYTLDKLKTYQSEAIEGRIQFQHQMIQLDEAREAKYFGHLEQVKSMVKSCDGNIYSEAFNRKTMIENLSNEINRIFQQKDEKILSIEKSQLETEKKLIGINKDHITTLQEYVSTFSEKYEIENKSLKTVFEMGFKDMSDKYDDIKRTYENSVGELRASDTELRGGLSNMESLLKQIEEENENSTCQITVEINNLKAKTQTTSDSLAQYMREANGIIETKIESKISSQDNMIDQNHKDASDKIVLLEKRLNKSEIDTIERIEELDKLVAQIRLSNGNPQYEFNSPVEYALMEKKISDKFEIIRKQFEEYEKKIVILLNLQIESVKLNFTEDHKNVVKDISDNLDAKLFVLKKDLDEKLKQSQTILEGRTLEYIIESENRIKLQLENKDSTKTNL